ncbi:MAG TPA: hypothetical protein VKA67_05185, partial [Verrucomicrobiae bacterium]|nr:hypothetical protein [Verrucomicrobiae bacterium]
SAVLSAAGVVKAATGGKKQDGNIADPSQGQQPDQQQPPKGTTTGQKAIIATVFIAIAASFI